VKTNAMIKIAPVIVAAPKIEKMHSSARCCCPIIPVVADKIARDEAVIGAKEKVCAEDRRCWRHGVPSHSEI
jgi:hypothetical protein